MKAKLIIALMYSNKEIYRKTLEELKKLFGDIDKESQEYNFDQFTKFYEKEFGKNLVKRFISFKNRIEREDLADIKLKTTQIEKEFSKENKREINLDPGYLTETELVLASFKKGTNYKQDIGKGIYAHKVLEFKGNKVEIFWHTFPDYRVKENQEWFNKV